MWKLRNWFCAAQQPQVEVALQVPSAFAHATQLALAFARHVELQLSNAEPELAPVVHAHSRSHAADRAVALPPPPPPVVGPIWHALLHAAASPPQVVSCVNTQSSHAAVNVAWLSHWVSHVAGSSFVSDVH